MERRAFTRLRPTPASLRRGFTLIEVLVVMGVIAIATTFSIPAYRTYQARNDLNLATEQTLQGLARAKLLSQSAKEDSVWGFFVPSGALYKGQSYAERDSTRDEMYPMPSSVTVSGTILEVSYSKLEGRPSATGSIILTAVDGQQRIITISISVDAQSLAAVAGDTLSICHRPGTLQEQTMMIIDSAWPIHQGHGDTLGPCAGASSSSAASTSSTSNGQSSSGAGSSSSTGGGGGASSSVPGGFTVCHKPGTFAEQTMTMVQSAWNGHQKHGDVAGSCAGTPPVSTCPGRWTIEADGTILTASQLNVTARALASEITYGTGGPTIPVTVSFTKEKNKHWSELFDDDGIEAGMVDTVSNVPSGSQIALKIRGYYRKGGWLSFSETAITNDGSDHTIILRRGDPLPSYLPYGEQQSLRAILASYLDASNHLTISASSLLVLTELSTIAYPPPSSEDFQDAVLLLEFAGTPACS